MDELNDMKYYDLQKIAKSYGLKVKIKREKLIEAILNFKKHNLSEEITIKPIVSKELVKWPKKKANKNSFDNEQLNAQSNVIADTLKLDFKSNDDRKLSIKSEVKMDINSESLVEKTKTSFTKYTSNSEAMTKIYNYNETKVAILVKDAEIFNNEPLKVHSNDKEIISKTNFKKDLLKNTTNYNMALTQNDSNDVAGGVNIRNGANNIEQSRKTSSPKPTIFSNNCLNNKNDNRENKRKHSSYEKVPKKSKICIDKSMILKEKNIAQDITESKKKSNIPRLNRAYVLKKNHIRDSMGAKEANIFVPTVFSTKGINFNFSEKSIIDTDTVIAFGRRSTIKLQNHMGIKNTEIVHKINNKDENFGKYTKNVVRQTLNSKPKRLNVGKTSIAKRESLTRASKNVYATNNNHLSNRVYSSIDAKSNILKTPLFKDVKVANLNTKSGTKKPQILSPGFSSKKIDFVKEHKKLFNGMDSLEDYARKKNERMKWLQSHPLNKLSKA